MLHSPFPDSTAYLPHSAPVAHEPDTRDCIVQAALALFAKHGIDGVSLRQIVMAAGQSNPSAVHYHFRSKEGLVNAVVDHVTALVQPMQVQAQVEMALADQQGRLTVHEVVRLTTLPLIQIYASGREGRMAIRFLSRLTWQPQHEAHGRLMDHARSHMETMAAVLHRLLPHRSHEALSFLVPMFMSNLVHGLADISLLGRQPTLGMAAVYHDHPEALLGWFVDYIASGLVGRGE